MIDHGELAFPSREAWTFPILVNVEVHRGSCPCQCVHCPVGRTPGAERVARFGRKHIRLELYSKIVAEVAQHPWSMVRLHSVGDPILWDQLAEALRIGSERGAGQWLFTSAITRKKDLLVAIAEHADIVEISANSVDAADYRDTKGIDAFDLLLENIRFLHGLSEAGAKVRILVSRTQTADETRDQEFVTFWRSTGLVHDGFVRSYHTYNGLLEQRRACSTLPTPRPCLVHWARMNITAEGLAVVCFNELFKDHIDPRLVLGDLRSDSVQDIWHGPALDAIRRAQLSGEYADLPSSDVLPCRACTSCQPLFGSGPTSESQMTDRITPSPDPRMWTVR